MLDMQPAELDKLRVRSNGNIEERQRLDPGSYSTLDGG